MASRTIAHTFDHYKDALNAITALEAAGIAHDDISLVANRGTADTGSVATPTAGYTTAADGTTLTTPAVDTDAPGPATGAGLSIGTLLGGGAGLLAGIGALAIPGVGPIIAAGWLVATLTGAGVGAAAGGLLGSLTGAGIPEDQAHVYAESVRRGGTLVTVRTDDSHADQVHSILNGHGPVDVTTRGAGYRAADPAWTGFDPQRGALTEEELAAERARVTSSGVV